MLLRMRIEKIFTITDLTNTIKSTEPVQITIPDNPSLSNEQSETNLRGAGDMNSACLGCIACFALLILLGFLIGAIVSFTTGNITGGIICIVLLVLCCCGEGGGAYANNS
ncbi:hypothetical protein I4U23_000098 [Adineta vaga]|nr:hypothetical protein I4U23_000098 [Adineta vaga]